ncbi:MAG: hydrogenase formation protein HypD [Halobacteriota archaeon]
MKFDYRNHQTAQTLSSKIAELVARYGQEIKIMHVCGTHEASITRFGVRSLLPEDLKVIMGPGCPVCITPQGEIDAAIQMARDGITIATYGDLMRVPGSEGSLAESGGDVHIVGSIMHAIELAKKTAHDVVFIAVGFETTAPTTSVALLQDLPSNFSVMCSHRLIPPALQWLLERVKESGAHIDGFLLPGHVSTIIGLKPFERFPVPQVVAGFEPNDILYGFYLIAKQIVNGEHKVENAYPRVVQPEGNVKAQGLMRRTFDVVDLEWRGFPVIPESGYAIKHVFEEHDAQKKYDLTFTSKEVKTGCICNLVLQGLKVPTDCTLFARACTPYKAVGPCMVSGEGACNIWYKNQ